jgi:predicted TIM-barrel fold metal-dependent hydrolase
MAEHGIPVIDVDSHVYEPESIWSDYLAEADRAAARRAFSVGAGTVTVNGVPARSLHRSRINRYAIWRPGSTPASIGALDPEVEAELNPGAWDPEARLRDLDVLGIDQQIVLPLLFGEYFPVVDDAEAAVVLARAYNDWANDFARAGDGRLHPTAVLPLQDVDAAVAELGRVAARGARSVLLRPMFYRVTKQAVAQGAGPASGMVMFGNPNGVYVDHFRPLWSKAEELGVVVCVHPYLGITNAEATSEGSFIERVSDKLRIGHSVAEAAAYMEDSSMFVVIAAFHGLLEDHPNLRLALLHGGASMVPLALEKAETYLWLSAATIFVSGDPVCLEPEEVFERTRALVGFDGWESSAVRQTDFFGTKGAWGSRYPHHDATTPADAIALCERYQVPAEVVERLLGGNAADIFGLPLGARV